jgi:hypothetical protein
MVTFPSATGFAHDAVDTLPFVTPAPFYKLKSGVQGDRSSLALDSRFRGNDGRERLAATRSKTATDARKLGNASGRDKRYG